MSFRENLREALDFTGMRQQELADKTGISLKTIENYVKKESSIPAADRAVQIAQVLGVTVEYLVNGQRNEKSKVINVQHKNSEILNITSKLNKNNNEILSSIAKTLLTLQNKKN